MSVGIYPRPFAVNFVIPKEARKVLLPEFPRS